jgi:hypothetical protein
VHAGLSPASFALASQGRPVDDLGTTPEIPQGCALRIFVTKELGG